MLTAEAKQMFYIKTENVFIKKVISFAMYFVHFGH